MNKNLILKKNQTKPKKNPSKISITEINSLRLQRVSSHFDSFRVYNLEYSFLTKRHEIWFKVIPKLLEHLKYSLKTFFVSLQVFDTVSSQHFISKNKMLIFSLLIVNLVSKKKESPELYVDLISKSHLLDWLYPFNCTPKSVLHNLQDKLLTLFDSDDSVPILLDVLSIIASESENQNYTHKFTSNLLSSKLLLKLVFSVYINY